MDIITTVFLWNLWYILRFSSLGKEYIKNVPINKILAILLPPNKRFLLINSKQQMSFFLYNSSKLKPTLAAKFYFYINLVLREFFLKNVRKSRNQIFELLRWEIFNLLISLVKKAATLSFIRRRIIFIDISFN